MSENLNKPQNHGQFWSTESEKLLSLDYGQIPTASLAKALGRTVRATKFRASQSKIPFIGDDGRISVTEAAQITGESPQHITRLIRRKRIAAERVGRSWRIKWDGESEIIPNWDWRSRLREHLLKLSENVSVPSCIFCNEQLKLNSKSLQTNKYFCDRKCRFLYSKNLKIVD